MSESNESSPEQHEIFVPLELSIVPPRGDKNFMIAYEGNTKELCRAYNTAISQVLTEQKLQPFHQIGAGPDDQNKAGYHGWEVWKVTNEDVLKQLLRDIQAKAQEIFDRWREVS